MNFIIRLFVVTAILVLFTVAAFADEVEEYYAGQLLFISSDHWTEGDVDHRYDALLYDYNLSTSTELFPNKQPMRRWGAVIGKGVRKGNNFIEYGVFVDPRGEITSRFDPTEQVPFGGQIDVRRDSIALFALVGTERGRFGAGGGVYAMGSQADVRSHILQPDGEVVSYSDQYNEASAGLVLKLSIRLTGKPTGERFSVACIGFRKVDNRDSLGTDDVIGCGIEKRF
ncbi:MAG: hypothetical protein JAY60_19635 [Candidatus Thiodiazotropha weberae]|nr:hypothetical protein [Candidatus Thiodiazotropha weberae]